MSAPAELAPVYVPRSGSDLGIAARSGIVGLSSRGDRLSVQIDYEGNLYDAVNLRRYVERVRQAHGRAVENYPTVARRVVKRNEVQQIGWYDPASQRVLVDQPTLLARWLECDWDELPIEELE